MKKKRIAIYARVSTLDQNREMQLRELHAYAKRAGFVVAAELVDRLSSKKETRPQLEELWGSFGPGKWIPSWFGSLIASPAQ